VVVDIGAGTGIFSLLACHYGARRVYSIEPNDAIAVAQASAQVNGFADRIVFIQDLSTRITLPEPVDVVVSDIRDILPLFGHHLPSIIDARKRFLRPGGAQIPQCDHLWVTPVEAPDEYERKVLGHHPNPYGVSLEAASRYTCNSRHKVSFKPEQFLAEPQIWTTLDYTTLETNNVSATVNWTAARSGLCHGLAAWFEAELAEGISFTTAPGQPVTVYGHTFFPWHAPVDLTAGDLVTVTLKADLVGNDYVWRWDSRVNDQKSPQQVKASFQQSDFLGTPRIPAHFRKRSAQFVPNLNEEGQIERFIFTLIDGHTSLHAIAQLLCERYPERFKREQDAIVRVAGVSSKFSR